MKVGDLIKVGPIGTPRKAYQPFISVVTGVQEGEDHPNGMWLVQVIEDGKLEWYPVGYVKVINERR